MNLAATLRALNIEPDIFREQYRLGLRARHPFVVALHLGALGYRVFPATMDKTPLCMWKAEASSDPRRIFRLYRRAVQMIGDEVAWCICTGRDERLWVFDIDGAAGRARFAELDEQYGPLPETVVVTTGRREGGTHCWKLPTPDGPDLKTVAHAMIGGKQAPIDQKGRGGYAVVPGSLHRSGKRYEFVKGHAPGEMELASFPSAWLPHLDWADNRPESNAPRAVGKRASRQPRHDRVPRVRGGRIIGDHEGGGGFQNPIFLCALDWWRKAGPDASEERVIATLWSLIKAAPKGPGRNVERYRPGNGDLERAVRRAREIVMEEQEPERENE